MTAFAGHTEPLTKGLRAVGTSCILAFTVDPNSKEVMMGRQKATIKAMTVSSPLTI